MEQRFRLYSPVFIATLAKNTNKREPPGYDNVTTEMLKKKKERKKLQGKGLLLVHIFKTSSSLAEVSATRWIDYYSRFVYS